MQAGIPVKVYHSNAREHDSLFIQQQGVVNKGEVALFDKAYNNYALFDQWNSNDTYFVTRLKNNAKEVLLEEFDLSEATPNEILRDVKTKENQKKFKLNYILISTLKRRGLLFENQ